MKTRVFLKYFVRGCNQFHIDGYSKPFRFDWNWNGGGVLLYAREDIACRELNSGNLPNDIEGIFIELDLWKVKWFPFSTSHSISQSDDYYFSHIGNCLDAFSSTYDWFLLGGDFNAENSEEHLFSFLERHNPANIIKDKTCFKILDNPSCIDLFIINR